MNYEKAKDGSYFHNNYVIPRDVGPPTKGIINKNDVIHVGINRGPASVFTDNYSKSIQLSKGDTVQIKQSSEPARFIYVSL